MVKWTVSVAPERQFEMRMIFSAFALQFGNPCVFGDDPVNLLKPITEVGAKQSALFYSRIRETVCDWNGAPS